MPILTSLNSKPLPHPVVAVLARHRIKVAQLAAATGYERSYTSSVLFKRSPGSDVFRRLCAEALGMPESELFDPQPSVDRRKGPHHARTSQGRA